MIHELAPLLAPIWVFDVDATLLDGMSATSVRPGALELLSALLLTGRRVFAWSAGGDDYARRRLTEAGLVECFENVHDKGERGNDRCYRPAHFLDHISALTALFIDDQPIDLPTELAVVGVRPYLAANSHDTELLDLHQRFNAAIILATLPVAFPAAPLQGDTKWLM